MVENSEEKSEKDREGLLGIKIIVDSNDLSLKALISQELTFIDTRLLEEKGIRIDSANFCCEEDDNGGFLLTEFMIGVGSGVLTTYTAQGLLYLIKLIIEKFVNKVPRAKRTSLVLETENSKYDLLRTEERLKFKATVNMAITDENREAVDKEFEEISQLIIKRF